MSSETSDTMPFDALVEFYKSQSAATYDVFGVILFTTAHPYVVKVLRDNDLWAALDKITGQRWVVFAVRPDERNKSEKPSSGLVRRALDYVSARIFFSNVRPVVQPIPTWSSPQDNLKLLEKFQVSEDDLPLLLVFTELPSKELLQMQWHFAAENEDKAFNALKTVLEKCTRAVAQVQSENIKNNEQIFNLMVNERINYRVIKGVKKGLSIFEWLKSLFS
jgi:hypothetical protein